MVMLLTAGRMMPSQLLKQCAFGVRYTRGELHGHLHLLITTGHRVTQFGKAFVGQSQDGAGLGARWNLQGCVAINGLHLDRVPQDRLQITDVHRGKDVETIPAQPGM